MGTVRQSGTEHLYDSKLLDTTLARLVDFGRVDTGDTRFKPPRPDGAGKPSITLVHLAYSAQGPEVCGKAFDFSPASAVYRWEHGYRDMVRMLERWQAGQLGVGAPGLSVHAYQGQDAS